MSEDFTLNEFPLPHLLQTFAGFLPRIIPLCTNVPSDQKFRFKDQIEPFPPLFKEIVFGIIYSDFGC
jgi:hypothetical protein